MTSFATEKPKVSTSNVELMGVLGVKYNVFSIYQTEWQSLFNYFGTGLSKSNEHDFCLDFPSFKFHDRFVSQT